MSASEVADRLLVLRSVRFACERHSGQQKTRQHRPTIDHVLEVAELVCVAGFSAEVVAAAVLHDTIEKADTRPAELELRFGARVRALVEAVTDTPSEGQDETAARLKSAPPEAQSIKCADIISNLDRLARGGNLTASDRSDKAAVLALLMEADGQLRDRARAIIERGTV